MLVVRIELWPHGNEWKRKTLAKVELSNTGGSELFADYRVESDAVVPGKKLFAQVLGHPRRAPILDLATKALLALGYGEKAGG
jgi:hypothetical protein